MSKSGRASASLSKGPGSLWTVLLLLIGAALSGGCLSLQDPESFQDDHSEAITTLSPEHTIGQSLVSRRPGLNGISLWLAPHPETPSQAGEITFDLYRSPEEAALPGTAPLESVRLPFIEAARQSPLQVSFSPQPDPPNQAYYLLIRVSEGRLLVYGRNEEAYPAGEAYLDGEPVGADLGFRLSYDYGLGAFAGDLASLLREGWLVLPLIATLLLPGWALLDLLDLTRRWDGWGQAAISLGLSVGLVPVLMLWTGLLGLRWRPEWVLVVTVLLGLLAVWRVGGRLRASFPRPDLVDLGMLAVLGAALIVRMIMARDLAAPPWVDSIHHGLITRLIVEQGVFPDTYSPYIDIGGVSYHPGFHSVLALFQWLSGMELSRAMLLLGQVLNAFSVLSVYLLTTSLVGSRTAALGAAFITALITPMPAYYTSWGRYTQLAGLLILPIPLALIQRYFGETSQGRLESQRHLSEAGGTLANGHSRWKLTLATSIAGGGLFLTHYRVAIFMAALLAAYFLTRVVKQAIPRLSLPRILKDLVLISGVAVLSLVLVLPWLIPTLSKLILPKASQWGWGSPPLFSGFSWGFLTSASGIYAMALAGVGLAWGLLQRRWFSLTLIGWVAIMFLSSNLGALGLPGGGLINNLSVEISLFMPISLLGGYILGELNRIWKAALPLSWHAPYYVVLVVLGILLGVIGARRLAPILNPITFLFRQADRPGIAWVAENVPPDETVLVNPFAWGYGLHAGADGGYWITSLAGRRTLPPPVIYGLSASRESIQAINHASQSVIDHGSNPEELAQIMRSEGVRYVFIGSRGGVISSKALEESLLFERLYWQGDVWVFRLR